MKTKVILVSLFDGIGGAIKALKPLEIEVVAYYSSEINLTEQQFLARTYPKIQQLGDIIKIDKEALKASIATEYPNIPILLVGGSPCQGFSKVGHMQGVLTTEGTLITSLEEYLKVKGKVSFKSPSYLIFEYLHMLEVLKPKWYLLENVKMSKSYLNMFDRLLKTTHILLNSNLVVPQNRIRAYWTNAPLGSIQHTRSTLEDILGGTPLIRPLTNAMKGLWHGTPRYKKDYHCIKDTYARTLLLTNNSLVLLSERSETATYRELTMIELERLQGYPDNYTKSMILKTDRRKAIGNSFTVPIITELLRGIE